MDNFVVKELEFHVVPPRDPHESHCRLPFTTLDIMQKRSSVPYLQRVCFFPSSNKDTENMSLINRMKESLSLTLTHFYPLAGRLYMKSEGARPELDCNSAGVEFSVASADACLDQLEFSQPQPWFEKMIQRGRLEYRELSPSTPFLTIQVTKFKCGSICLAWSYDHLIMDGSSQWYFMKSWSEICRGLELSSVPNHDRNFEQEHKQFADIVPTTKFSYSFQDVSIGMESKIFTFDTERIGLLKSQTNARFSSFEVVASLVWISLCKARSLPDSQKTSHQIAINCRSRLDTPLPPNYFGNCVLCTLAESTVGELITNGLSYTASVIHEAVVNFQRDEIRSMLLTYNGDTGGSNPFTRGDTWGGSSPRFPMYELDFGWGKPTAVRHARKLWDGFCFYDPSPAGGIEVTVFLPLTTMSKFSQYVLNKV